MKNLDQNFQQTLKFYAFLIFKVLEFKQILPKMKDSFMHDYGNWTETNM